MATHSGNSTSGTHIKDSTVNIDTLNVNKTSTHEEIIAALPVYHLIDATLFTTNPISLVSPVNIDYINNVMFFVDGASLMKLDTGTTAGPGYFLSADGNSLTINGVANLTTKEIHGLYTDRP
jgi:hypothetical protein